MLEVIADVRRPRELWTLSLWFWLLLAAGCDSSSVTASSADSGPSDTNTDTNTNSCSDDTECPYWRCECRDGTVLEGAVCGREGCQNDADICEDCVDHGGRGKTYLFDPGDWPDDAAPTIGSGMQGVSAGTSGGASGSGASGSGASGSGAGSGSGGGSGGSAGQGGGSAMEGALCPMPIACSRAGSSNGVYEYKCEGHCTGEGTITLAPGSSYECRAFPGDFRPPSLNASGFEAVGGEVSDVGFHFQGYGGGQGVPFGLKPGQDCHAPEPDDEIVVFDQPGGPDGAPGVVLPVMAMCGMATVPEELLVAGTFNGWVCADCPYYENGEYYAAFSVAFNLVDDDVIYDNQALNSPKTKCTISGGATLGGCHGPPCTNPDPFQ